MRELGFSQMWDKLGQETCTTFRFPRKDKDWYVGEIVRVVFKGRTKQRKVLGVAEIISKEDRRLPWLGYWEFEAPFLTGQEALVDGFTGLYDMYTWISRTYGSGSKGLGRCSQEPLNKLTLRWMERSAYGLLFVGEKERV